MGHGYRAVLLPMALLALAGCQGRSTDTDRPEAARAFPRADRPVSNIGVTQFSTEDLRDSMGEARTVMDLARIAPGMTVADLGAGEGYYTVRLAERVGAKGRVLAEDIDKGAIERLGRDNILTSHHLTGWTETADGVRAEFIDRATGKPVGSDLRNGLITAPALYVLERSDELSARLSELVKNRQVENDEGLAQAVAIIKEGDGIEKTFALARSYGDKAIASLDVLADSAAKDSLISIVEYVLTRSS